jgi:hypothetical protein
MKLIQALSQRFYFTVGRMFRETGLGIINSFYLNHCYNFTIIIWSLKLKALDQTGSRMQKDIAYLEPLSRHRNIMPLYDLVPSLNRNTHVSSSCTIIG